MCKFMSWEKKPKLNFKIPQDHLLNTYMCTEIPWSEQRNSSADLVDFPGCSLDQCLQVLPLFLSFLVIKLKVSGYSTSYFAVNKSLSLLQMRICVHVYTHTHTHTYPWVRTFLLLVFSFLILFLVISELWGTT